MSKNENNKQTELKFGGHYKILEEIKKLTYPQKWKEYNLAKTQERIIAETMLLELLNFYEHQFPHTKRGKGFRLEEKIYHMFIYNYTGHSARRCISELAMAQQRGVITRVPHFNTILNHFSDTGLLEFLKKLLLVTALPLRTVEKDFAVDASGFSTSIYDRWMDFRTQKVKRKKHWKKGHIIVGVQTQIITSLRVTNGNRADSLEFVPLTRETSGFFTMREVSADKAYLGRANMEEVASLGAIPYIPFRENCTGNARGSLIWSAMYDYFANNFKQFMKSYHKRSNVETAFSMIKRNFGVHLKTKNDVSHVNEIFMKCICHNLSVLVQESFEIGLKVDLKKCAEIVLAQKKKS